MGVPVRGQEELYSFPMNRNLQSVSVDENLCLIRNGRALAITKSEGIICLFCTTNSQLEAEAASYEYMKG